MALPAEKNHHTNTLEIFSILSVALSLLDDAVFLFCSKMNSVEVHSYTLKCLLHERYISDD